MPDTAGSWPEEGTQYVPGAPMEPVQQQPYQPQQQYQQPYPQQQYQQQGYPDPQYAQQQYQQQPPYPEQAVPQQAMYAEEEQSSVPSEFDHLFRDSPPQERRPISSRQPMVSGPGAAPSPGFQQQVQQAPPQQQTQVAPQAAATAMFSPPQQQAQQPMQGYDTPGQQTEYVGQFGGRYDGPDDPGGSHSGGSGPGGRRTPLVIGGVVVVIAAVGLYLGLSGGGGSANKSAGSTKTTSATAAANPAETAQQQADAVYALVKAATTLRDDIGNEVQELKDCKISTAQSAINTTAQARSSAASQVAKLPVGKISGASALITDLQTAWQDSATSDQDYAKAAGDFAGGGCSEGKVTSDPNYQAAAGGSSTSASAKTTAANLWNQVMANYEPKINEDDL
jgi:hypothetical protein